MITSDLSPSFSRRTISDATTHNTICIIWGQYIYFATKRDKNMYTVPPNFKINLSPFSTFSISTPNLLAGTERLWHSRRWPPELDTNVICELKEPGVKPLPFGAFCKLRPVGQILPHKS